MISTHVMRIQENEVEALKRIAASADNNGPVLMLNQNRYSREAGYPTGREYLSYITILEATVGRVGGKVLWRSHVQGQLVGCEHDRFHEILAIWYPSHKSFLKLSKSDGADLMLRLRQVCVENAVVHRCKGGK